MLFDGFMSSASLSLGSLACLEYCMCAVALSTACFQAGARQVLEPCMHGTGLSPRPGACMQASSPKTALQALFEFALLVSYLTCVQRYRRCLVPFSCAHLVIVWHRGR